MAGIYGIVGKDVLMREDLDVMSKALIHRGPDDEAHCLRGNVGMGCRRLAVLDLDRGQQPLGMSSVPAQIPR